MIDMKFLRPALTALAVCIGALSLALAQNSEPNQRWQGSQRDSLAFLQKAIEKAGAPALSADQQTQLQTLVQNYHSVQRSTGPDTGVQNARQNFESAILSGNSGSATAAADALASAMAANTSKHLEALAGFEVQALGILQPQASVLQQNLGNQGLVSLLGSLAGGPGMRPGMGRFGRR